MTEASTWLEANRRYLAASLAVLRRSMERYIARVNGKTEPTDADVLQHMNEAVSSMPSPSALENLCSIFCLSPFERNILLLCAGMELDSSFGHICASSQDDPVRGYPTFSLALAALDGAHWSALDPASPLRYWQLIEVGTGNVLTLSPLRINERILHYLTGSQQPDERLAGIMEPLVNDGDLIPSQRLLAEGIARIWSQEDVSSKLSVILLYGDEPSSKRAIAIAACTELGMRLNVISSGFIPNSSSELDSVIRLLERESVLGASALLLDLEDLDRSDASKMRAVTRLAERIRGALIVISRERHQPIMRRMISIEVPRLDSNEQRAVWKTVLGRDMTENLNGGIDMLVSQFRLSERSIHSACQEAFGRFVPCNCDTSHSSDDLMNRLWDACRVQARPRLEDLAQKIEPSAEWSDLVLPGPLLQTLKEIVVHVRHRAQVYESWGFASRGSRGLGISALFAGASGTGKTMAAEVMANDLRLDLYRIDLSQVVSKYIGETEKNLRRVFEAAEDGGAILLFDEADALFGKRSDVKDSHDRYANIEISYLLQRMESYRGLAILTTNMKEALDTAFTRRIRFIVQFPFPNATQRAEIWRRVFPRDTPTEHIDVNRLAKLNMTGGNIHNTALYAAFLAAESDNKVNMSHILRAVRAEYAKMEQPLTEAEIGGWL